MHQSRCFPVILLLFTLTYSFLIPTNWKELPFKKFWGEPFVMLSSVDNSGHLSELLSVKN